MTVESAGEHNARNGGDLIADAEFLLTEGGGIRIKESGRFYDVDIAEKAPCWLQLESSGPAGHGSRPLPDSAVARLIRALAKVIQHETEIKVTPAVQAYFAALAAREEPEKAAQLRALENSLTDPTFRNEFLANPSYNALVRNTISPTVLEGSNKTNVIPAHARAQLDCRLLPGEDPQQFVKELERVVDDPQVTFSILMNFPSLLQIRVLSIRSDRHFFQYPYSPH
jgi:acetylornithine deacetylase/succinyl-diaminopimelate desuccinylase-like protein